MKTFLRNLFTLLLLTVSGVGWAAEESVTFSAQGYSNGQAIETYTGSAFSIAFSKGTNSNAPKYYTSGTAIRAYGGNTFTVSSDYTITKIVLTFGSSDGANEITSDVDSYLNLNGTWEGSSKSVVFTISGTTGNRRLSGVTVTYDAPAAAVEAPTFTPAAGVYTGSQSITLACATDGATIYYTTDGSEPSAASTEYTVAINLSETTTIKAIAIKNEETSEVASATYTFVGHAGTEVDPYTVADACTAIDAGSTAEVYVTGIVSEIVTAYDEGYKNISFNISSDGSTISDQFQAYRCAGTDPSVADIAVGDIVVIKGNLTKYNSTYELAQGNQLISRIPSEKQDAGISYEQTAYEISLGDAFTAPTLTNPNNLTVTYASLDESVATVDANGEVTILAIGSTTITASFAGNDTYKAGSASYTLTVVGAPLTTISELQGAATSTSTPVKFTFNNVYVTAVKGKNAYICDENGYGALIYSDGHGLTAGQVINGTTTFNLVLYKGATEITDLSTTGLEISEGTLSPSVKTIDAVTIANQSTLVKFENVTYDETAKTFSDGTNSIAYYDTFSASPTLVDCESYNVTGIVSYHDALQICPRTADDVVALATEKTATATFAESTASIEVGKTYTNTLTLDPAGLIVTYASGNSDVATISAEGVVTGVAVGTTEITVSWDEQIVGADTYKAGTASYSLTVEEAYERPVAGYEKITSTADLEDGKYLIVYEDGSLAFNGSLETLDAVGNSIDVTISHNVVEATTVTEAAEFTIETIDGGYTVKSASGKYIGQTSDANGLKSSETEAYSNAISFDAEGNLNFISSGAYLCYNKNSDQTRFRYYKSDTYTKQQPIALYKKYDGRTAVTITFPQDAYTVGLGGVFKSPVATVSVEGAALTYNSSNTDVATVDETSGAVTIVGEGSAVITASYAGTEQHQSASASYTLTVIDSRVEIAISFPQNNYTVALNETFEAPTPTVKAGEEAITVALVYSSDNKEVATVDPNTGEVTLVAVGTAKITAAFEGNEQYKASQRYYTLTVTGAKHSVIFSVNGTALEPVEVAEDAAIPFPDVEDVEGMTVIGWTVAAIDGISETAPEVLVTSAAMGNDDVTYYAVFANETPGTTVLKTDELTYKLIDVSGTSYSDWTEKKVTSTAVYAGNSAGGNDAIQLRATKPSGIISTVSGGKLMKIEVVWNTNTANERTLDIYGSNEAYKAASELYNSSTRGTKIGSIANGSTELTVDGDYQYIGIRSNDGALYLDKISITWDNGTPATYSDYCTTVPLATKPGDVNKDGNITIADVTALVDIILGKDSTVPYQFDHEAANVNGDESVTIADVTKLVDIILGKE